MSMPYRISNGTKVNIRYAGGGYRNHFFSISVEDNVSIEEKYNKFVETLDSKILFLNNEGKKYIKDIEEIERFLYGATVEELCTPIERNTDIESLTDPFDRMLARTPKFISEKTWDREDVVNMDCQMFIASFYVFVFSDTTFEGAMWGYLQQILLFLSNCNDLVLSTKFYGETSTVKEIRDFWNVICELLYSKIANWCNEENCWNAFTGITKCKPVFEIWNKPKYDMIEKEFCSMADTIALDRIKDNINTPPNFELDVNNWFFYDEYFELDDVNKDIKTQIRLLICNRYISGGMYYKNRGCYDVSERWYEEALKYANEEQKEHIYLQLDGVKKSLIHEGVKEWLCEELPIYFFIICFFVFLICVILFVVTLVIDSSILHKISLIGGIISLSGAIFSFVIALILKR